MTLAEKLAAQYAEKAATAFRHAQAHMGADYENGGLAHVNAYTAEGFHWLRAQRAAEAGDTSPKPFLP